MLEPSCRIGPMRSAARFLGSTRFRGASLPIWSCSVWGLPCLRRYRRSGAPLPHLFTLTPAPGAAANSLEADRPRNALHKKGWPRRYVFCGTSRLRAFTPASRMLSGTLPCGVRTFLPRNACALRQRPPGPPAMGYFTANAVHQPSFPLFCMALWIAFQRARVSLIRRLSALRSR